MTLTVNVKIFLQTFMFSEPCLSRTLLGGSPRPLPWPEPSPPLCPSHQTPQHVSKNDNYVWHSNLACVRYPWMREGRSLMILHLSEVYQEKCLTNFWHLEYDFEFALSLSEFAKIKEKQKAWKVDNGLRVHEVTKSDHHLSQNCFAFRNNH